MCFGKQATLWLHTYTSFTYETIYAESKTKLKITKHKKKMEWFKYHEHINETFKRAKA